MVISWSMIFWIFFYDISIGYFQLAIFHYIFCCLFSLLDIFYNIFYYFCDIFHDYIHWLFPIVQVGEILKQHIQPHWMFVISIDYFLLSRSVRSWSSTTHTATLDVCYIYWLFPIVQVGEILKQQPHWMFVISIDYFLLSRSVRSWSSSHTGCLLYLLIISYCPGRWDPEAAATLDVCYIYWLFPIVQVGEILKQHIQPHWMFVISIDYFLLSRSVRSWSSTYSHIGCLLYLLIISYCPGRWDPEAAATLDVLLYLLIISYCPGRWDPEAAHTATLDVCYIYWLLYPPYEVRTGDTMV